MSTLIAERYLATRLIGRGGMGEVHLAQDIRLNRNVALKCISSSKDLTPNRRRRQEREARAIAALSHPSIAQIYDVVTHDEREWLVLEFVEGTTLRELLAEGPLDVTRGVNLAIQVSEALEHAHGAGILHRDLKADNVMISEGDRVHLLDFGLAKIRGDDDSLTEDGVVVGTLSSVSPEQAEGREVDERSDLFSLGTLLYQMFSGRHPFKSDTATATLTNVVRLEPKPMRQANPDVPAEVAELVHHLLAKDPNRRPASALEVKAVLERYAGVAGATASGTMSAVHASIAHGMRRHRTRIRRTVVGVAIIGVVAVAVLAGMFWPQGRPEPLIVAVAEPTLTLEIDGRDADPVSQAVRIAAINTLADLQEVYPTELDSGLLESSGLAGALRAAGATEAFTADLSPSSPGVWSVRLRRRAEPGDRVLWTDTLTVLEEETGLVREAIRQAVVQGWGERPRVGGRSLDEVRPEDFRRFVDLLSREESLPDRTQLQAHIDELQSIRTSSPGFLDAYTEEVLTCLYAGRLFGEPTYLERAREVFAAMQHQAPDDMRTLVAGTRIARLIRNNEELGRLLATAREIAPTHPETLRIAAIKAWTEGDYERAMEVRRQLVRLHPSTENLRGLAETQRMHGQSEQALETLERVLEMDPNDRKALIKKANILALKDPYAAASIYSSLLNSGDRLDIKANWATVFLITGQIEQALEIYQRAIENGDRHSGTMLGLADCYRAVGNSERADYWYQQVVDTVSPHRDTASADERAFEIQAVAHLGDLESANRLLDELVGIEPDVPGTVYAAALVATFNGDFVAARAYRNQWMSHGHDAAWFNFPWFDPLGPPPAIE